MAGIIIGNKEYPCNTKVHTWHETGLEFKNGHGARPRNTKKTIVDLFLVHDTGGEADAVGVFHTLEQRELGVEFYIDREKGEIWEFCDPLFIDTFDGGLVNPRSFGVEIANFGSRDNPKDIPRIAKDRRLYKDTIRGHEIQFAAFYDRQLKALYDLIVTVCGAVPTIPFNLAGKNGAVLKDTMNHQQLAAYKGIIGHFQLSDQKIDPSPDALEYLHAKGIPLKNAV